MKLRAKITRTDNLRTRSFKAVFPAGTPAFIREAILQRNLGPRPYGEASFTEKNGEQVRIWFK